ncbi:hypothetical protein E4U52_003412 [Claviceps spartinae]|nr:hypothetical protein E4U52_003412 [Claviceps spartinae]
MTYLRFLRSIEEHLEWFRAGNYREDDYCGLINAAKDIPSLVDFGTSNNTSVEPEEYPLTFAEVIGIRPADQHRQEEIETIGNRHLDLQDGWRPLLWWRRRQMQMIGLDVASQHDEDLGASLNPPP